MIWQGQQSSIFTRPQGILALTAQSPQVTSACSVHSYLL